MRTSSPDLIRDLRERLLHSRQAVASFRSLPLEDLNACPDAQSWSILQCLEHLNLYGDYYLPELERRIRETRFTQAAPSFRSGWLGNYFANLMLQEGPARKKMKAPSPQTPGSQLSILSLDRFEKQCDYLLDLLERAARVDLTRTRTSISLTRLIRLRLGDTLRFVVYHIGRHVAQAQRVQAGLN